MYVYFFFFFFFFFLPPTYINTHTHTHTHTHTGYVCTYIQNIYGNQLWARPSLSFYIYFYFMEIFYNKVYFTININCIYIFIFTLKNLLKCFVLIHLFIVSLENTKILIATCNTYIYIYISH